MKPYPPITDSTSEFLGRQGIAFKKLDGSNLSFLWHRKHGWCRHATRKRIFDETDVHFGHTIKLFHNTIAEPLQKTILKEYRDAQEFIIYCEYFGPHSFAGQHEEEWLGVESNDPKKLVPIDINIHKSGILPAKAFVDILSGQVEIPEIVYRGELTNEFINEVQADVYNVGEGVVVKGCQGKPPHGNWSCKIKTNVYLDKLRKRFGNDWKNYV